MEVGTMLLLTFIGIAGFVAANYWPVATFQSDEGAHSESLLAAISAAQDKGATSIAVAAFVAAFALPLFELALYAWVLLPLRYGVAPRGFATAMNMLEALRPWSVVEVFVLVGIACVVRLEDLANVTPEPGLLGLGIVTLSIVTLRMFEPRELWARVAELGAQKRIAGS
jgi:paraquat-inducible protein A